jgi:hypothetical protein
VLSRSPPSNGLESGSAATALQSGDPRERRRCPAWRFGAVFTEWCRSLEALPSRMWDSGRDHHPAGCEVSREALQQESSPRIVVGRKTLTEESSCEAEHMAAPTTAASVKKTLAKPELDRNSLGAGRGGRRGFHDRGYHALVGQQLPPGVPRSILHWRSAKPPLSQLTRMLGSQAHDRLIAFQAGGRSRCRPAMPRRRSA